MRAVLDASALLAYLRREPGAPVVREVLEQGCAISAANWAEVLSKVAEGGEDPVQTVEFFERGGVLGQSLIVHPLNDAQALEIARLRPLTREAGLSLGDRACLALAASLALPVLTTDRAWSGLDLDLEVELVR